MTRSNSGIKIALSRNELIRHAVVWLLVLCFLLLNALEVGWPFWFSVLTQTPYWVLYIAAFYGLLYQACSRWHQNKAYSILQNVAILITFLVGYVVLDHTIPEYVPEGEPQPTYPLWSHIFDATFMFAVIAIPAFGVYLQKYNIARIEANSKKAIELIRVKERLVRQELNFYKSEFNTHITFNTLSHIYAKVMDDPELASPVLILSDILRYNLKVQAHQEVPIEQELRYLESFIEIHRVLFPKLQVRFLVEGELQNARILSRILISFVENAIKHGDKGNIDHPIKVVLKIDDRIYFSVKNKKKRRNSILTNDRMTTRTGIKNTQRTLKAFYQDRYRLKIEEDQDVYGIQLCIDNLPVRAKQVESTLVPLN